MNPNLYIGKNKRCRIKLNKSMNIKFYIKDSYSSVTIKILTRDVYIVKLRVIIEEGHVEIIRICIKAIMSHEELVLAKRNLGSNFDMEPKSDGDNNRCYFPWKD